ncbi:hypothetical protein PoB_005411500 [Plakobranchus ocellatus]|uniref:Uncharacterized protein n=1 Tax=Plakobranchus ocellatus TaxID=259542 RepID=A0AAV4C4K7_9GAST|nr:hypothetical protein PoB_005411500 [Plakobranchus ocellatus]
MEATYEGLAGFIIDVTDNVENLTVDTNAGNCEGKDPVDCYVNRLINSHRCLIDEVKDRGNAIKEDGREFMFSVTCGQAPSDMNMEAVLVARPKRNAFSRMDTSGVGHSFWCGGLVYLLDIFLV